MMRSAVDCALHGTSALVLSETSGIPPGETPKSAAGRKLITFTLNSCRYAVFADFVSEIVQSPPVTSLPRASSNLLGVACLRGEMIAILNLTRALGGDSVPVPPRMKLIVLNGKGDEIRIAVPVDRIGDTIALPEYHPSEDSDEPLILDPETLQNALAVP